MTVRTADELDALAERCIAAKGPSRTLDRLIEETRPGVEEHPQQRRPDMQRDREQQEREDGEGVYGVPLYVMSGEGHPDEEPGQGYLAPSYTGSQDVIAKLIRAEGLHYGCGSKDATGRAWAWVGQPDGPMQSRECFASAVDAPLALSAAYLGYRAQRLRGDG